MRKEKGFTLIELMIVVGIIALIAAMAIPNFITYRNKSRVATAVGTISRLRCGPTRYKLSPNLSHYRLDPDDYASQSARRHLGHR
jgi:prepilin-type N-terminal cleavage/methylation domain-containing protein